MFYVNMTSKALQRVFRLFYDKSNFCLDEINLNSDHFSSYFLKVLVPEKVKPTENKDHQLIPNIFYCFTGYSAPWFCSKFKT